MDIAAVLGVTQRHSQHIHVPARFEAPTLLGRSDRDDSLLRLLDPRLIELGPALL